MIVDITLTHTDHAVLEEIYHNGRFIKVVTDRNEYGPIDKITGAEFRCLGNPGPGGQVHYPQDYKPGAFYPPNVFITGVNDDGYDLDFDDLECARDTIWEADTRWVYLPKRYDSEGWSYQPALMYTPVEAKPPWHKLGERLQKKFPDTQVTQYPYRVEVMNFELDS